MSDSPSSSRSSSPPLALDPSTLAILNGFLNDKAAEERRFKELQEKAEADAASGEGEKMLVAARQGALKAPLGRELMQHGRASSGWTLTLSGRR